MSYVVDDDLLNALIQQESGGNHNAVSRVGARGITQVMPRTGQNPGFGVMPLRNNSEEEYRRFGRDYLGAMLNRYNGNKELALAAYNAGPGTVDKAGGVPNIPETQNYVKNIMSALNPIGTANAEETPQRRLTRAEWKAQQMQSQQPQQKPLTRAEWKAQQMQYKQSEQNSEPSKNFGERLDADLRAIPRQTGLAARYAIEGLSGVPDVVAAPVIAGVNTFLPQDKQQMNFGQMGTYVADKLGLPQPENSTERIVGDASRMLAGTGGIVGAAGMAKNMLTGGGKALAEGLSYRPDLQAASAAGAGLSGGYTRETGGGPTAQAVASVAGGLIAPGVVGAATGLRNAIDPRQVSSTIQSALENNGINPQSIPRQIMAGLEDDVAKAMQTGDVSGDALKRLIDYRLVGATPGRGNLTLTPADITQQKNLAKIGINSSNPKLQALANQQNDNTGIFINKLNSLGAEGATDAYSAGNKLIGAVKKPIAAKKAAIGAAYDAVRNDAGVSAAIDPYAFTQRAGDLLNENLAEGFLTPGVRSHLNKIASGETPLTVSVAEQLKTVIGKQQRGATDGNTRHALGLVRQALDEAPLLQQEGQSAIDAANKARGLNREWMQKIEKTPALKAVIDGASPDDFVQKQIINADVQDLARLKNTVKGNGEAIGTIKAQIMDYLKRSAVGVNPDEARVFTQAGLNKAIDKIGEQKLRMFLSNDELTELKALGRVARYEQVQPVGSAVNNSNTAGSVISSAAKYFPFGKQALSDPFDYLMNAKGANSVYNVPNALVQQRRALANKLLPAPMLLIPGQVSNY